MPAPQIRIPQSQVDAAARRGDPATIIRQDLDRYAYALAEARSELRKQFDGSELTFIAAAMNGILHDPRTVRLLYAEVEDALNNADVQGPDGPQLVAKLRALPFIHSLALVDATERWWNSPGSDPAKLLEEGR